MSQPSRSQVHVNRPLTTFSIAYIQEDKYFIADKVFPILPVAKQSDRYFVYTKDDWFRTQAQKRGPATESAGSGFNLDNTPTYFADVWSVHMDVDDQTRENADQPVELDRDATLYVTQQLLLRREISFMTKYMTTGVWTGSADFQPNVDGKGYWDSAQSNPMADVNFLMSRIMAKTGYKPNVLAVAQNVDFALQNNFQVIDRVKYTQTGVTSDELLAKLFKVDKYLVAGAVLNSAQEGQAGSFAFLANNNFLLVYAAPAPSILKPSGGYLFSWQQPGGGVYGNLIKVFRMEHLEADRVEGKMSYDMKIVGADLGAYGYNVLAAP